jgi:hypothetical protein
MRSNARVTRTPKDFCPRNGDVVFCDATKCVKHVSRGLFSVTRKDSIRLLLGELCTRTAQLELA